MNQLLWTAVPLVIGALIGLLITRAYYRKGAFSYFVKDFDLIDQKRLTLGDRIRITADDVSVNELRIAKVVFWNSGSVCYERGSIANNDTLRVNFPGLGFKQVLDFRQSRRAVSVEFKERPLDIDVTFELFDEGDWVVARILYQGESVDTIKKRRPELTGALVNLPSGFQFVDLEDYFSERHWLSKAVALALAAMPILLGILFFILLAGVREFESVSGKSVPELNVITIVGAVVLTVTAAASVLYQISRWLVVSKRVPKAILKALK